VNSHINKEHVKLVALKRIFRSVRRAACRKFQLIQDHQCACCAPCAPCAG